MNESCTTLNTAEKPKNSSKARVKKLLLKLSKGWKLSLPAPYADNSNVKKLKGRDGYRLRIGNVRVIYDMIDDQLLIRVIDAGFRGSIY